MAILPIVTGEEQPVLRTKTKRIEHVTKEVKKLLRDMRDTLKHSKGVGLAAPQVGSSLRVCLALLDGKITTLLNPDILSRSEEQCLDEEGCLSLPDLWLPIPRAAEIVVRFMDEKGKMQERKLRDFDARVVQHELDHLNGVLIVDYVEDLERMLAALKQKQAQA